MKPSKILRKGAELYRSGEIGLNKGCLAIDASGRTVRSDAPDAVKCCTIGMVCRLSGQIGIEGAMKQRCLNLLQSVIGGLIAPWNDRPETTIGDVIALFERAAALAESEGC